jgi:hypothetical protein
MKNSALQVGKFYYYVVQIIVGMLRVSKNAGEIITGESKLHCLTSG